MHNEPQKRENVNVKYKLDESSKTTAKKLEIRNLRIAVAKNIETLLPFKNHLQNNNR